VPDHKNKKYCTDQKNTAAIIVLDPDLRLIIWRIDSKMLLSESFQNLDSPSNGRKIFIEPKGPKQRYHIRPKILHF